MYCHIPKLSYRLDGGNRMSGTEDYLDGLLNSISEKDLDTRKNRE